MVKYISCRQINFYYAIEVERAMHRIPLCCIVKSTIGDPDISKPLYPHHIDAHEWIYLFNKVDVTW